MKNILTHSFGKSFPPSLTFSGYVFMTIGIITLFSQIIIGSILLIIGAFVGFTKSGIQINLEDHSYRDYNSFGGLKQGKWKSLSPYKYITLLVAKEVSATLSASNRRAITGSNTYYDICLLNDNHRKKLVIKRIKDKQLAASEVRELSALLHLPLTKYHPNASSSRKPHKNSATK